MRFVTVSSTPVCDADYPRRVSFSIVGDLLEKFQKKVAKAKWSVATKDNTVRWLCVDYVCMDIFFACAYP